MPNRRNNRDRKSNQNNLNPTNHRSVHINDVSSGGNRHGIVFDIQKEKKKVDGLFKINNETFDRINNELKNDNEVVELMKQINAKYERLHHFFQYLQSKAEEFAQLIAMGGDSNLIDILLNGYDDFKNDILDDFITDAEKAYNAYNKPGETKITFNDEAKVFFNSLIELINEVKNTKTAFESNLFRLRKIFYESNIGRSILNSSNLVDWDENPTVFENTTIGLGHILTFKQLWKSDGYSIGDVEGSVVLQPMQVKYITTHDWTRVDRATRSEVDEERNELSNEITKDSDSQEIISSVLSEDIYGSSSSNSSSRGGSVGASVAGGFFGAIFGISGGYQSNSQSASASSSQNSRRNLAAGVMQSLKDSVQQHAASIRNKRSTVIQEVSQSESSSATSEIIVNYNRRHSLTTMWFSIHRHFVIEQELANVQECLFFPLPITKFDIKKANRWRDILRSSLKNRLLRFSFGALERVATDHKFVNYPEGRFADEKIEFIEGEFTISFDIPRIPDPDEDMIKAAIEDAKSKEINNTVNPPQHLAIIGLYEPFYYLLRRNFNRPQDAYLTKLRDRTKKERDYIYEKEVIPLMVNTIVNDYLKICFNGDDEIEGVDFTLVDKYDAFLINNFSQSDAVNFRSSKGIPLKVKFRVRVQNKEDIGLTRAKIETLNLRLKIEKENSLPEGVSQPDKPLPDGVRILVHTANIKYTTQFGTFSLYRSSRIMDDLNCTWERNGMRFQDCNMKTMPMSFREIQNPRDNDNLVAARLIDHLNQHLEYYHKAIWMKMDSSRLFRLLDGYIAPNSNGRSVASVVDSNPIGVIGNNIIFKVVPGANLDPRYQINEAKGTTLLDYYKPQIPFPPYRITVKNPGLYGESILGKCESAETIDDSKLWKYEDLKIPYVPTALQPASLESRYQAPGNLQSKDFAAPMINMQTLTPEALKESTFKEAIQLMGKGDSFRDATGLKDTQDLVKNAQNKNVDILKNATDAANKAMDIGSKHSLQKQKQDLEAYKEFSKNATPEQKKKLQEAFMDSWGMNNKSVRDSANANADVIKEAIKKAQERNPNRTLEQIIDASSPDSTVTVELDADGSGKATFTRNNENSIKWILDNSDKLLETAKEYDLVQKEGEENLCWAYALAVTLFPSINFNKLVDMDAPNRNENIIKAILELAQNNNVEDNEANNEEKDVENEE